jgi:hypothetical protein
VPQHMAGFVALNAAGVAVWGASGDAVSRRCI